MNASNIKSGSTVTRKLKGWKMVGFSIGTIGQMAPIGIFNTFATNYYIYTVGLDPFLTFLGMFFGLMIFAVSSPIFGALIDNKNPGKFGKRRPFLLLGIPVIFVLMILAWTPPMCPVDNSFYMPTAIYFWVVAAVLYINQGLLVSTYLSMLAEQSTDEDNRIQIATLQGIFSIIGTIISILIPIILQSKLDDPQNPHWTTPSGEFLIRTLPLLVGTVFGGIGAFAFFSVYFSTNESFYEINNDTSEKKISIAHTFQQMLAPFRDKNYRSWLGNAFFFNMAIRILIVILLPMFTYVFMLKENQFVYFFLALLPFALGGYLLWTRQIKKSGLKSAYGLSLVVNVIFSFVALIFLLDFDYYLRFILGSAVVGILISSLVGSYLFPNPIVSILVDHAPEHLKKQDGNENQKQIAGSYFGSYIFSYNISQAIANVILTFILTEHTKKDPVFILISLPVAGILVFASYLFLKRLKLVEKNRR
ncbi:MAG: MFS transporter [Promethearchaeota archaeon]